MRLKGKPFWLTDREEDLQKENARRINLQLIGRMCPTLAAVIRKMRKEYSRYGKQRSDIKIPALGFTADKAPERPAGSEVRCEERDRGSADQNEQRHLPEEDQRGL